MISWFNSWWHGLSGWFGSGGASIASFPFESDQTDSLGQINRPVAWVKFWSPATDSWSEFKMLIDTGADLTLLPKYMAALLDVELDGKKQQITLGLGGQQKVYLVDELRVKIGNQERLIKAGIANTNNLPLLLGRYSFLETFVTRFEKDERVVFEG